MSDGMFLYWLYALKAQETVPHPVTGERIKQYPVYVQALEIKVGMNQVDVVLKKEIGEITCTCSYASTRMPSINY